MSEVEVHYWQASDGVSLAYRAMGEEDGSPVILVHGLFSDGLTNWIKFGHAAMLVEAGFRVLMPDLRAHGLSDAPHDPEAYPDGILGRDLCEMVEMLGLEQGGYDLGGFSLGSRTTVQAVGAGLEPRRAILSGMGLEGLTGWDRRQQFFIEAIDHFDEVKRGDPHFMAVSFMKTMGVDRVAARHLLPSFTDAKSQWLEAFTMPTAVICGTEDQDNGSAPALADALPHGEYMPIPGTHMSSVTHKDLGQALVRFLTAA
ncbi:alpha/beta fold hydrolase [Sphingomicrobium lutaoense]|uniref:Pimeloyl-ACP methyl ester carboxylesterase n=1 Tax=Sphingomicrobium lutaoense TaxID=515949 RepID=A0A839Z4U6_9SPHN|nr:alpha/beta fold hydrolase [Sphingomicrobium lutaoense]MBB3763684.1 pimeloyl-ACP methyl ester carboxylesterase [Sphingomicrobium lutaoense]